MGYGSHLAWCSVWAFEKRGLVGVNEMIIVYYGELRVGYWEAYFGSGCHGYFVGMYITEDGGYVVGFSA